MDSFITTTPFFSSDHRALAERMAEFAEREIEVRAGDDEGGVDEALRGYVMLLQKTTCCAMPSRRPVSHLICARSASFAKRFRTHRRSPISLL